MRADQLIARFPEVSGELRNDPTLAEFAATFDELLAVASKPGNCTTGYAPGNHFYLALIGPLSYLRYGLATRERVVEDMRALLDRYAADPEGFAESLLPEETPAAEIKGPGCA